MGYETLDGKPVGIASNTGGRRIGGRWFSNVELDALVEAGVLRKTKPVYVTITIPYSEAEYWASQSPFDYTDRLKDVMDACRKALKSL